MQLEIGQKLYRWISPYMMSYIVTGMRIYESDTMYEVECQSCRHGWKCELLVTINDYDKISYVKMLNNDPEGSDQRCWHNDENNFWLTEKEAQVERARKAIAKQEEKVDHLTTRLKEAEDTLEEMKNIWRLMNPTTEKVGV